MDLHPHSYQIDLSVFLNNEEWDLLNVTVRRKRDYYNYGFFPILSYTYELKRKPFYYVMNLCMPSFFITVTALIGYHMPSTSTGVHQEKVKMGLTAILSIFILQLGIVDKMPRSSDVIPLISIFYFLMVSLLSMAIVSTSLIIVIEKQGLYGKPVPHWLKKVFFCKRWKTCASGRRRTRPQGNYSEYFTCNCSDDYIRPRFSSFKAKKKEQPENNCDHSLNHVPPTVFKNGTEFSENIPLNSEPVPNKPFAHNFVPNLAESSILANQSGDYEFPDSLGRALINELDNLRRAVNSIDLYLTQKKTRCAITVEWSKLADRVETISLYLFLSCALLSLLLFFKHGWY